MQRKSVARIVSVLLLLCVVLVTGAVPLRSAVQDWQPWPPFVMTYVETVPETASRSGGVITHRLDYRSLKDWRVEILSNTGRPAEAGSWTEYKGDRMRAYDAMLKRQSERDGPSDGVNVVAEWLIPRRAVALQREGWQKIDGGAPGMVKLVSTERLPCVSDYPCLHDARVVQETRTFDARTLIPLSVRAETHGQLIHEIAVVDLVVQ